MESEFVTWMDRYYLEFPDQVQPDTPDASLTLLRSKGIEHEDFFLNSLKEQGLTVVEIAQDDNSYEATMHAMTEGKDVIYQAHLSKENFAGYADFLFKIKGTSRLGNWHYEPWDTKLALKSKPYFIIQLCCYAEMLESVQGKAPEEIHVVLGDNCKKSFRLTDYFSFYQKLKNSFLLQQKHFNPEMLPELIGLENTGRWTNYAEKMLQENDSLSLVANIRGSQIKKLKKDGIFTMAQLAKLDSTNQMPKIFSSLQKQADLQIQSRGKDKPDYEIIKPCSEDPRKGLALLPPASTYDVWFDIEGDPFIEGGLEYLFGISYLDEKGTLTFKDWWAHDHQQEKESFKKFVTWAYARWQENPDMHIYHYAPYEVTALKRLMGTYGVCENEIDNLLRAGVFVDLYKIVSQGLRIGEPSYSLKNIEHLYMDKRISEITKSTDSIVFYERWREKNDGNTWQESQILKGIRDYNKDDCFSIKYLCDWLRKVQKEYGISYLTIQKDDNNTKSEQISISSRAENLLALELLNDLKSNKNLTEEQKFLTELFSYLLEFHRREDKPAWWMFFDRPTMTEEELIEDLDCLGGLERSNFNTYKFDPSQDTKLMVGDECYLVSNELKTISQNSYTIQELDNDQGLVSIIKKRGSKFEPLPQKMSLIPKGIVRNDILKDSIYGIVKQWRQTGILPQAIEDFLLRRCPRINKQKVGLSSSLENIVDVIKNMDNTTLCIQGPPGSGKTYTAANAIVELICDGKTVGVTSNSHRAIANLIDETMQIAQQKKVDFRAVKIQNTNDKFHVQSKKVRAVDNTQGVFALCSYMKDMAFSLIGGTAWAFSNEAAKGKLDYLFVDEAGQISIANLVAMSASTSNIILMGDQMQLSQPIRGSHPGESGKSCLEYFLKEYQTIPQERGIFLDRTYRLHPDICKFISSAFYEGRLENHEKTSHRQIILPSQDNDLVKQGSGILFVPVEHENNTQSSSEEVESISKIVKLLLRGSFKDNSIERPITLDDILIVAPYNKQVHKIKDVLPQVKVASVDKFQGQEAPIVIVSMCASNIAESARGLEFLLSKNRLNVAISRAQVLAIVVGNPKLANTPCKTIAQMELVNLFCRITEQGNTPLSL